MFDRSGLLVSKAIAPGRGMIHPKLDSVFRVQLRRDERPAPEGDAGPRLTHLSRSNFFINCFPPNSSREKYTPLERFDASNTA